MSHPSNPRIPSATYRLQFHAGFTFREALAILDYLDQLGVTDLYASPYFQASPDSTHGYDVADHNRLNPAIGDASDFRALVNELKRRDMGHVLDFVPNHMGIGESLNRWWMEVLEDGPTSPRAQFFDIDWDGSKAAFSQKVLLPILGERYGVVLESGALKLCLASGTFSLHYYETRLPFFPGSYPVILRPAAARLEPALAERLQGLTKDFATLATLEGEARVTAKLTAKDRLASLVLEFPAVQKAIAEELDRLAGTPGDPASFDALHELLELQFYRLSYWRVAAEEINYRRFFDINTLAALRIEIPEVFEAAHQLVFELLRRGDVTGLRIDHVDGLWNPLQYFERLQARFAELQNLGSKPDGLYLVVEKILDLTREQLPQNWPVHGTTGYEFTNQAVQVLVDASAAETITAIYQKFTGITDDFATLVYEKKKLTMQLSLRSEVTALGRLLDQLSELHRHYRDFTRNTLTSVVNEVIACFPVYRTYVGEEGVISPEDEKVVLRAIIAARRRNPSIEKAAFDFLRNVLMLRLPETLTPEERERHLRFVMKFQQCSGPVMAKGLEDTAFYHYNRLVALNEVGGDPGQFGFVPEEFHRLNAERQERSPNSMLATSTHDTKRSEGVRMRLAVLSEIPAAWRKSLLRWSKWNQKHHTLIEGEAAPSANEEYLLYQALLGTWPLEPFADEEARTIYRERIQQYMLKAIKEAKVNSSWTEPNEAWEQALSHFVESLLDPKLSRRFLAELAQFADQIAAPGALNSLAETILKCTAPGVPDLYQGTEIWDFSLVDPDNRRPVDYEHRRALLASLENATPAELLADWTSGRIKLFVVQRLLHFRRAQAEFFRKADYRGLAISGAQANNLLGFTRRWESGQLLVLVPRLTTRLGFPPLGSTWRDTAFSLEDDNASPWENVFTGATIELPGRQALVAPVLADFPFAVLWRAS